MPEPADVLEALLFLGFLTSFSLYVDEYVLRCINDNRSGNSFERTLRSDIVIYKASLGAFKFIVIEKKKQYNYQRAI